MVFKIKSPDEITEGVGAGEEERTEHLALRQSNIKGQGQNEGCRRRLGGSYQ